MTSLLVFLYKNDKWLAAICASPKVLGAAGLLQGKKAVCYPGHEDGLIGAEIGQDNVVVDGKIITSKGPGTSSEFALKLIEVLCGKEKSVEIGTKTLIYR